MTGKAFDLIRGLAGAAGSFSAGAVLQYSARAVASRDIGCLWALMKDESLSTVGGNVTPSRFLHLVTAAESEEEKLPVSPSVLSHATPGRSFDSQTFATDASVLL